EAGGGCRLGCEFCTVTQMYGKKFRTRPVEHVVEEIKRFKSKRLFFVDDNIFLSRSYAYELFEALVPLKIKWGSQGSMELICRDEDLLELAARSGCVSLFVAIETTDQEPEKGVKKQFTEAGNKEKNTRKIQGGAISGVGFFILGSEKDPPKCYDKVLDLAGENRLSMVNCGILTPFPGSATYAN